jgi:glutaredoxin
MRRFIGPVAVVLAIVAVIAGLWYVTRPDPNDPRTKLAQCLTEKGVTFYAAYWCPHCTAQKKLFGRATAALKEVECGVPGNTQAKSQACQDAKVESYPTWEFADGTRLTGEQTLKALAEKAGCTIEGI